MPRKDIYSKVAISRGEGNLLEILRADIDMLGGIAKYVKEGDTVFIKPNLTAGMPAATGGTTDVYFTEAVVELVKEAKPGRIIVGECSGNESRSLESLTNLGYADMCQRQGVEMVDLDFAEFVEVSIENHLYKPVVNLPKLAVEADVFITVPVLKNHIGTGVTMALKNSFGLIPDADKLQAHRDGAVERILADISSALRPALVFIDGRIGAEGIAGGTDFERPKAANLILVGDDPVATDMVGTHLMMQDPRVRHIRWAAQVGIGNDNLDYIQIYGLSIEEAQVRFMTPAEQVMEDSRGKVRIHCLQACSLCRALGEGGVARFSRNANSLLEPVDVVMGPGKWDIPEDLRERTVLVGDCVREEYRSLGNFVGGCPVSSQEYAKVLAQYNIVCTRCAELTEAVMADYTPEQLADIRVLASNKTIFQGANNQAKMDDYLFAVGDCQKGYCRNHIRRIHKISDIDASVYIEHVKGCCPDQAQIKAGLDNVIAKASKA